MDDESLLRAVPPEEPSQGPGSEQAEPASTHPESAESILPGAARVGPLDALLREVDHLRLTLETDLTLAAAAVESGGTETAADIINDDLQSLHFFEESALAHLTELADAPAVPAPRRRARAAGARQQWLRVSAAPFVAAAAVLAFFVGVVPMGAGSGGSTDVQATTVSAQSSLEQLMTHAAMGNTHQVRAVAATLHEQIRALVSQTDNPRMAQQALLLLSQERTVIVQSGDGAALQDVLRESQALANRIRQSLPPALRTAVPAAPAVAPSSTRPPKRKSSASPAPSRSRATESPRPRPSATPSPTASSKPSARPSSSPRPSGSASPSDKPFLPGGPQPAPTSQQVD